MSHTPHSVRGMNDILPQQSPLWDHFERAVRAWLMRYGYRQIRMPLVESTELFKRSIGEATDIVEKEMYTFVDALNQESLTLRPEGTASCVRAVLQHNLLYHGPLRLYYTGPMFRHERPQKGRFRQFHQIGVEALGYPGPDMDAEHIVMTARLWRTLKLPAITLQINTLGSPAERARFRTRLVKYLEQNLDDLDADARRRLHANPLRALDSKNPAMQEVIAAAPRLLDDLGESSVQHFATFRALLESSGIAYEINPKLVRGLDYYNYTVYEWVTTRLGAQGAICAGGRYDGLLEQMGGKPAAACGFAIGIERVLALMGEQMPPPSGDDIHAYVLYQEGQAETFAWKVAETLRDAQLNIVLHCGGGNLKSQMKKADTSGARYAIIVGEDEMRSQDISVKPLRVAGDQLRMQPADFIRLLNPGGHKKSG
jgi:histidyl-tRNA synthetase